jgi:hypothetical protein
VDKEASILFKQIDDRVALLTQALVSGRGEDYAAYKYICGQIQGLNQARSAIEVLTKKVEFEDE